MIQNNKKKLNKSQLSLIITAAVLVILIVAYLIINAVINSSKKNEDNTQTTVTPEIESGEALYNNRAVVYPFVSKSNIVSIAVSSHVDAFAMSRPELDGGYENYFMLYYGDENDDLIAYYPEIMSKENGVDYKDFYAVEGADGLGVYKIDYLCATIGALYFDQRILPEEDRDAQLKRYGLDEEHRETIYFSYLDNDGKLLEHKIFVGDSLISGVGYYFMIEGRDYIYTSAASERFEYLLSEFESFLHSRIVPEGLPSDSIYEPYLTTDYKQWTNKYWGTNNGGLGKYPTAGSEIVILADVLTPIYDSKTTESDGYSRLGFDLISIDLARLANRPELDRLISTLLSTPVGDYEGSEIHTTVISNVNEAKLGSNYRYVINKIESVINASGEHYEVGREVSRGDLVKLQYDCYLDGERLSVQPIHAVVDLAKEGVIPENVKQTLLSAKVGDVFEGEESLRFDVVYTTENALTRNLQLIITDIVSITRVKGNSITNLEKITEDCIVTYNYKYLVDGYEIDESGSATVDLSAITEGDNLEIKNAILGLKVSKDIDKCVLDKDIYCQAFMDFVSYQIRAVKGYVERDAVVSFEFVNASGRDPFYGESIYKNTLDNQNRFYALDALACQQVTFLLGGIGGSSSSQVSGGLSGSETVAVGLTPKNMDKYGLYDGYTVYFELPRGITVIGGAAEDEVDDYTYLDTLGTYLYISKLQSDGTRYVGSSLYDIIVKIEGTQLNYLERSFEEFWSRKNLVMVDYNIIDKMTVELNMSDVFGKYEFDLDHKLIYISGNNHYDTMPEEGGTPYNFVTVTARPLTTNISDSVFKTLLATEGRESMDLANVYNRVAGYPYAIGHDTAGTANFKKILSLMYGTNYVGALSEEEREGVTENSTKIMSVAFTLDSSKFNYVYDFYRVSDRRVMVHIYRTDLDGNRVDAQEELSGFYISTFGAKKIVNAFTTLLNGGAIDVNDSYWS